MKTKAFKLLSAFLSFCLLLGVTTGITGQRVLKASAEDSTSNAMIYLEGKSEALGQNVYLEQGKTYTISFKYKFLAGSFTADWIRVVIKDRLNGSGLFKTYLSSLNASDFTVVAQENFRANSYTFTWNGTTGTYAAGLNFIPRGTTKIYIADFKMTESSFPDTNMITECNKTNGLYGWLANYSAAVAGSTTFAYTNCFTATLVDYDVNYFKTGKAMIYLEGNSEAFGQNVSLVQGKTYTISFKYKFLGGSFAADWVRVVIKDRLNGSGLFKTYLSSINASDFTVASKDGIKENSYTFTWSGTSGTYAAGLNFIPRGTTKMYIADFKMTESSAPNTNMLIDCNYLNGLYGWLANYSAAAAGGTTFAYSGCYTATLVNYNESIFKYSLAEQNIHFGTLNGDEQIDIRDLVIIKKIIDADSDYLAAADLSKDGINVGGEDIVLLKQYLLGFTSDQIRSFTSWRITQDESGIMLREAVFDSGLGGESVTIVQLTDLHFNCVNQQDESNATVMSTYANRAWNKDGSSIPNAERCLAYADAIGDQTVLTGDVLDYLSYGALEKLQSVIWDKFPETLVTLGNHERLQKIGGSVDECLTIAEKNAILEANWKHDIYYTSKVIKNKVMVIQLDNGQSEFYDSQIEPLTNDINLARANGYTVLIFMHIPICTNNPSETAVAPILQRDSGVKNYCSNQLGIYATGATKTVYDLITKNADVVKGVFTGHMHSDYYTEIIGSTAQGEQAIIPQYVLISDCYDDGHALKITVR